MKKLKGGSEDILKTYLTDRDVNEIKLIRVTYDNGMSYFWKYTLSDFTLSNYQQLNKNRKLNKLMCGALIIYVLYNMFYNGDNNYFTMFKKKINNPNFQLFDDITIIDGTIKYNYNEKFSDIVELMKKSKIMGIFLTDKQKMVKKIGNFFLHNIKGYYKDNNEKCINNICEIIDNFRSYGATQEDIYRYRINLIIYIDIICIYYLYKNKTDKIKRLFELKKKYLMLINNHLNNLNNNTNIKNIDTGGNIKLKKPVKLKLKKPVKPKLKKPVKPKLKKPVKPKLKKPVKPKLKKPIKTF